MASSESEGEHYEVDEILGQRKKGRYIEYLVRWKGFGEAEDSWEPSRNLKHAKSAIDRYLKGPVPASKQPSKTPARKASAASKKSSSKDTEETSKTSTRGGKVVTKTTTVTKVVTQSLGGNRSESSSPEASPLVSRRSTRQVETQKTVLPTPSAPKRAGPTTHRAVPTTQTAVHAKPFFTKYDVPIIIFVSMMAFVALSFVFEHRLRF